MKRNFSVSAYIEYDAKILLVNHVKQNAWVPVGGRLELDELPIEAVVREVLEETALVRGQDYEFADIGEYALCFGTMPGMFAYEEHEVLPSGMHMCFSFLLYAKHNNIRQCPEYTETKWISVYETKAQDIPLNVRKLLGRCFNIIHGR